MLLGDAYGLILGCGGRDGALRATVAGVGGINDCDLVNARCRSLGIGGGEDREKEGSDLGMHFESGCWTS
jgi:hypothetical protein